MSLLTTEQQTRFTLLVARVGASKLRLSCLTADEREFIIHYLDLWMVDQELIDIMEGA